MCFVLKGQKSAKTVHSCAAERLLVLQQTLKCHITQLPTPIPWGSGTANKVQSLPEGEILMYIFLLSVSTDI